MLTWKEQNEDQTKTQYTAEFKERRVKRVKDGPTITVVRNERCLGDQIQRNWIAAANECKLAGGGQSGHTRNDGTNCLQ